MLYLKQSTASQPVLIGPFIDDTDGKTAETGLTIANTDIRLSANGGNMFAKTSGGGTHDEAGWYTITLDATDTATVGRLQISTDVSGALPTWAEFQVLEEDAYEWMYASGAAPDTQIAAIKSETAAIVADTGTDGVVLAADAITAAKIADNAIATEHIATGAISADSLAADTITAAKVAADVHAECADAVWDEVLTGASHNDATSAGKRLRQLEQAFVHHSGALGTVTDARTMILTGGVATDDYYLGDRLQITEGTGLGQSRVIIKYVGSTATATLDSDFIITPVITTSLFDVVAADVHVATSDADLAEGYLASVADASNVTMDAITAVSATDYYKGDLIVLTHGTGIGQSREIISQTGRALVVSPAFVTLPDTTSAFHIVAMISADEIATEVWDRDATGHQTTGTFGQAIGDPGANSETMYDAVVTDAAGTNVAADVIAVKADTGPTLADLEGLTLFGKSSVDDTGNTTTKVDLGAANAGSYADDELNGFFLVLFDNGTSEYHVREITDYTAIGELATVATLPFTPATDDFYWLLSAQAGSQSAPTAAAIVDEWETQSQADPTGFHVNVQEWIGTAVTLGSGAPDVNIATIDNIALSTTQKANVNAEVDAAIVTYGLDHLVFTSVVGADVADDSIIAFLVDDAATADWDGYDNTTASLEALNVDTDAIKAETALIVADTDVIDDGTSGLVKIASDVAAIFVDTGTTLQGELDGIQADTEDIQSRIPAALVGSKMDSNVGAISGSTTAANKLEEGAEALAIGTVNDGSASITAFIIALTGDTVDATDDHYNGRIITFTSGALLHQSTDITDYDGGTKTVTVTALTEAPVNGVQFVIS